MSEVVKQELEEFFNQRKDYNIFRILKMQNYSENRHSNFLAWLFNPNNFPKEFNVLNLFLESVNIDTSDYIFTDLEIDREFCLEEKNTEKGRADIVIKGNNFTCIIENKFGSHLKKGQCENYYTYFKNCKNVSFIYLDIDNCEYKNQSEIGDNHFQLATYKTNIEPILKELIKKDIDTEAKNIITSYLDILAEKYIQPLIYDKNTDLIGDITYYLVKNENDFQAFSAKRNEDSYFCEIFPVRNSIIPKLQNNQTAMFYYLITINQYVVNFEIKIGMPNEAEKEPIYNEIMKLFKQSNLNVNNVLINYKDYKELLIEFNQERLNELIQNNFINKIKCFNDNVKRILNSCATK